MAGVAAGLKRTGGPVAPRRRPARGDRAPTALPERGAVTAAMDQEDTPAVIP